MTSTEGFAGFCRTTKEDEDADRQFEKSVREHARLLRHDDGGPIQDQDAHTGDRQQHKQQHHQLADDGRLRAGSDESVRTQERGRGLALLDTGDLADAMADAADTPGGSMENGGSWALPRSSPQGLVSSAGTFTKGLERIANNNMQPPATNRSAAGVPAQQDEYLMRLLRGTPSGSRCTTSLQQNHTGQGTISGSAQQSQGGRNGMSISFSHGVSHGGAPTASGTPQGGQGLDVGVYAGSRGSELLGTPMPLPVSMQGSRYRHGDQDRATSGHQSQLRLLPEQQRQHPAELRMQQQSLDHHQPQQQQQQSQQHSQQHQSQSRQSQPQPQPQQQQQQQPLPLPPPPPHLAQQQQQQQEDQQSQRRQQELLQLRRPRADNLQHMQQQYQRQQVLHAQRLQQMDQQQQQQQQQRLSGERPTEESALSAPPFQRAHTTLQQPPLPSSSPLPQQPTPLPPAPAPFGIPPFSRSVPLPAVSPSSPSVGNPSDQERGRMRAEGRRPPQQSQSLPQRRGVLGGISDRILGSGSGNGGGSSEETGHSHLVEEYRAAWAPHRVHVAERAAAAAAPDHSLHHVEALHQVAEQAMQQAPPAQAAEIQRALQEARDAEDAAVAAAEAATGLGPSPPNNV